MRRKVRAIVGGFIESVEGGEGGEGGEELELLIPSIFNKISNFAELLDLLETEGSDDQVSLCLLYFNYTEDINSGERSQRGILTKSRLSYDSQICLSCRLKCLTCPVWICFLKGEIIFNCYLLFLRHIGGLLS